MPQLALFDTGPRVLLDDASGLISYAPEVIDAPLSKAWFVCLVRKLPGGRSGG